MAEAIKSSRGGRRYDASRRRQRADETRRAVVARARELFQEQGYAGTTIAQIAGAVGVSPELVYKSFGGKPGLVRAIYDEALLGSGAVPAEERSDQAQATTTDARALMQTFGRFVAEVSRLGAPVYLLIREAAANGDAEMRALREDVDASRYERMLHNARQVLGRGLLRTGLSATEVADVFFAVTSAGLYETLVLQRGWTPERLGAFVATTLTAALVEEGSRDE